MSNKKTTGKRDLSQKKDLSEKKGLSEIWKSWTWTSAVMAVFMIAVLGGLPIVYHNYYFDILQVKYYYYSTCVVAMLVLILGYGFFNVQPRKELEKRKGKKLLELFSVTDLAVLVFAGIATISTLLSPYKFEAFWGNEGRYSGLFLILLYTAAYFCTSRFFKFRGWYLNFALVAGLFVCGLGIADFFELDLLGFKERMAAGQRSSFTSFIGNINTYTALVGIYLGVASSIWVGVRGKLQSAFAYFCVVVSFVALILGISDNAFISIGAVAALLAIYAFRSRRGFRRYVVLLATFLTSLKGIEWVQNHYTGKMLWINSAYNEIVKLGMLPKLIVALWAAAVALYLLDYLLKKQEAEIKPWLSWVWAGMLAVAAAAVLYVLYDVNIGGNGEKYGSLQKYLLFNDAWGTNRGYVWKLALRDYKDFSPIHKIFGLGPDTFGLMTWFANYDEMVGTYNVIFDSAHNEYIHYFVTMGPIGLLSYLVILGGATVAMVKKCFRNPYVMAALLGVLCYALQALVNINQPIATPIMWTLLCMGMAAVRQAGE